jgi:hypothetical protein
MTTECEPVFVVGMNGSGTSMMLDSLGRHPELFAVPGETLMMPYIISNAGRFGDLSVDRNFRKYWQFAIDHMPVLQRDNEGKPLTIPGDWHAFPRTVGGVFDGIFSSLAKKVNKRRWCEKTPDHVQHLPVLAATFPRAKFIHLIRDGREVACSVNRRQKRQPELVIYRWKQLVRLGRSDGARLGDRYTELRYEDLTSSAEDEMRRVCQFLDLPFANEVLLSRMPQSPRKKRLAKGDLGEITSNPTKWPAYFDHRTVRRLESIGGSLLTDLGYVSGDTAGDRNPPLFKRKFWRAADFLSLTAARLKTSRGPGSKRKVLRKVVLSFKQYLTKRH